MIPRARIVHALPGRVRMKIGSMRGDKAYFEGLSSALADVDGVRLMGVDPRTATVLLGCEPGGLEALSEEALRRGVFVLELGQELQSPDQGEVAGARWIWREEAFDLRVPVALLLILLSLMQMRQGKILSPSVTLLWYAYELLGRGSRKDG